VRLTPSASAAAFFHLHFQFLTSGGGLSLQAVVLTGTIRRHCPEIWTAQLGP